MTEIKRTPLRDLHVQLGAKMVDFGGWDMPLQYREGILAEHRQVRQHAGLFDVSHMGEIDFRGPRALETVDRLVTNDVQTLADGRALYTVTCHEHGGIVDDCIVYRIDAEHLRIVVNASNIAKDFAHFREHGGSACAIEDVSDAWALIAVQGPEAVALTARTCGEALQGVPSFGFANGACAGVPITAARTGYTGEDGFEIFVPAASAVRVFEALLEAGAKPCGLGARDTLRLEARLSLYGNDIDDTTNPLEAGLGWVVKLAKRTPFLGQKALLDLKNAGSTRKLVGFAVEGRGIVRHGAEVVDADGQPVGHVTSGAVAPTVGGAVGLAYVPTSLSEPGTRLHFTQRGQTLQGTVVKGPFYRRAT